MRKLVVVMVLGLLAVGIEDAAAQGSPDDRLYLSIGFGVESGSTDSADSKQYTLYDEPATTNAAASWTSGSLFGGGIDYRVVRNFTVGVSYHQETNTSESVLTGTVPHPVFYNRSRNFTATAGGLMRKENATHISFGWIFPVSTKLDVLVSGGPSFFRLQQDIVSDVVIAERGGDFTEVVVAPSVVTQKRSANGFNAAVDATYILWQNDSVRIGAGGFVRYARAKSNVRLLVSDVETTVGGLQFGFGARFRF